MMSEQASESNCSLKHEREGIYVALDAHNSAETAGEDSLNIGYSILYPCLTWWCTNEATHGVLLHVLAHVDPYQRLLAVEHVICQRLHRPLMQFQIRTEISNRLKVADI